MKRFDYQVLPIQCFACKNGIKQYKQQEILARNKPVLPVFAHSA